jgi:hypothetical protein
LLEVFARLAHGDHITCQIRAHQSTPPLQRIWVVPVLPTAKGVPSGTGRWALGQQPATTGAHRWKAGAFALVASCGPLSSNAAAVACSCGVQGCSCRVCCFMLRLQIVPTYTRLPDHTCREQVAAPSGGGRLRALARAARSLLFFHTGSASH